MYYNKVSRVCFKNEVPIYICNRTALHIAVENENVEIVRILLSVNKIDVNSLQISISHDFNYIYN